MSVSETEWAWIAGLFEGEGSIDIRGFKVTLKIQMNDLDVLERLDALVPSPSGIKAHDWRGRKPCYSWYVCSRDVVREFLLGCQPFFGARRSARADEALAALAQNRGITRNSAIGRPTRLLADGRDNPEYRRWYKAARVAA